MGKIFAIFIVSKAHCAHCTRMPYSAVPGLPIML
jgi:hypothetical protein